MELLHLEIGFADLSPSVKILRVWRSISGFIFVCFSPLECSGFLKLNSILSVKELSDPQEVMREKELNLRTDIYEILLQDDMDA